MSLSFESYFTYTLTHSLTDSLTHSLTHSLAHSLTHTQKDLKSSRVSINSPPPSIFSLTAPPPLLTARSSLREAVFESSTIISPRFGHSAPFHDFVGYNRSRANSGAQTWQFPRSSLVYLRELGEGQFGKVLLMKTQVSFTC